MTTGRPPEEHWIDRLSVQLTRRATLKGALAAGIALMVPGLRAHNATAIPILRREKCFQTCFDIGAADYKKNVSECQNIGFLHGAIILLLSLDTVGECYAKAQVTARRDFLACLQPECGDRAKYPGGNKPVELCTAGEDVRCGSICCNVVTDCCLDKRSGENVCCARVPGGKTCGCAG